MPDQFDFAIFGAAFTLAVGGYVALRRSAETAELLFGWGREAYELEKPALRTAAAQVLGAVAIIAATLLAASRRTRRAGRRLGFVVLLVVAPADVAMCVPAPEEALLLSPFSFAPVARSTARYGKHRLAERTFNPRPTCVGCFCMRSSSVSSGRFR